MQFDPHFYIPHSDVAVYQHSEGADRYNLMLRIDIDRFERNFKSGVAASAMAICGLLLIGALLSHSGIFYSGIALALLITVALAVFRPRAFIEEAKSLQNKIISGKLRKVVTTSHDPSHELVVTKKGKALHPQYEIMMFLIQTEGYESEYRTVKPDDYPVPKFAEVVKIDLHIQVLLKAIKHLRSKNLEARIERLKEIRYRLVGEIIDEHLQVMEAHYSIDVAKRDERWDEINLELGNRGRFISRVVRRRTVPTQ